MEPSSCKLDFSDFKEKILEYVKNARGKDTVSLREIHANNGVIFTGIAFLPLSEKNRKI